MYYRIIVTNTYVRQGNDLLLDKRGKVSESGNPCFCTGLLAMGTGRREGGKEPDYVPHFQHKPRRLSSIGTVPFPMPALQHGHGFLFQCHTSSIGLSSCLYARPSLGLDIPVRCAAP